jgi:hypothetical protein
MATDDIQNHRDSDDREWCNGHRVFDAQERAGVVTEALIIRRRANQSPKLWALNAR